MVSALIAVGAATILGGGVLVGSVVVLTASAAASEPAPAVVPTAAPAVTSAPTTTATASAASTEDHDDTSSDDHGAAPDDAPAQKVATAPANGANGAAPSGTWWCTASASVRVCGFAGACNYQMVFGNGGGKDRFLASQQAKMACEASARAKGTSAVCVVQCSVR